MSEKTEKATPKKKRDERKKGNVFQSKDIVTLCNIGVAFISLNASLDIIYKATSTTYIEYVALMGTTQEINQEFIAKMTRNIISAVGSSLFILIMATGLATILSTGVQTRFLVSKESLKIKLENLSPIKGIQKMFSLKSLVEVLKSILKIIVLGYFIYTTVKDNLHFANKLVSLDIIQGVRFMSETIMSMVYKILMAFTAIAGFDFMFSLYQHNKKMKMSKQEIKEEYKESEGDPHVKGQRKQIQRQMSMGRMMQEVPSADVIIRNPTHVAIAIRYDIDKDYAPIVVAKGKDNLALKIVELAEKSGVNTIQNIHLARSLYTEAELNKPIPLEYFEPVAEILAWVYTIKEK